MSQGIIRAGMGGWTFEPWEGSFYPDKLAKKRQLEYASRQVPTIEVNGTYYSTFKPATFAKWASETPEGFVFSLKGNRFVTNRKVLATAGESIERFLGSGLGELGKKLGPLLWQFAPTKKFEAEDFAAFLDLLPREHDGVALRHALEVRHPSFAVPEFVELAARHNAAIVIADHASYPLIGDVTADFVYARLQTGNDENPACYDDASMARWADRARKWAAGGEPGDLAAAAPGRKPPKRSRDVFVYFIREGKSRAPHGASAFMQQVLA